MKPKAREGDRVRVFWRESTAPGARPSDGRVRFVCVFMNGVFVELDEPAPADAFYRLRFNGGERLVFAYHTECTVLPVTP
jgi:hypothetical protein